MFWKKSKKIKECCGNCLLYNSEKGECRVAILHEGQIFHIPVSREEKCFFGNRYVSKDGKEQFTISDEIKEIKMWVEDKNGNKTDSDGIVKVEYPKELDE
jgi:hypothetical protein